MRSLANCSAHVYSSMMSQVAIGVLEEMVVQGRDLNQFVIEFTWYMRNLDAW